MDSDKKRKHFINQPTYKGGNEAFKNAIYSQLRYPATAVKHGTEGIVYIEYDIDYKGNVGDTRVLQGIGHGCDEEACRVIKTLKFDVPTTRGVRIMFHKKVKVQFKVPKPVPVTVPIQPMQQQQQVQYTYVSTPTPEPVVTNKPVPSTTHTYSYTIKIG